MAIQRILVLDQALKTGVAWTEDLCATTRFSTVYTPPVEGRGPRYLAFAKYLTRKIREVQPDLLVYERPESRNYATVRWLVGLAGVIELTAENLGIPYVDVRNSDLTGHAIGRQKAYTTSMKAAHADLIAQGRTEKQAKGGAKKHAMVRAALARGWDVRSDDEADALWLLDLACQLVKEGKVSA